MREVFSSFYFPHFIGNLRWEVSTEASLRLTNPPNWWACHEWWKKPIHLAFLDYCHPSGPRPIGNGLGSTPDLVGSWVTGSLLARKRVIASNRSVGFLLLIQPTASSRHFDRQSNSLTPDSSIASRRSKLRSVTVPSEVWSDTSLRFFWESSERCSLDRLLRADSTHRWCGSQMWS